MSKTETKTATPKTSKKKKAPKVNLKIELSNLRATEVEDQLAVTCTFRDVKRKRKTEVVDLFNQIDKSFLHLFKVDNGRLTVEDEDGNTFASKFTRGHRVAISRKCKKLLVQVANDETVDPEVRRRATLCLDKNGKAK